MRKQTLALLAGAMFMMVVSSGVASATTIYYTSIDTAADKTSTLAGLASYQIETFDNVPLGDVPQSGLLWDWTIGALDNAQIVNGSVNGRYAAPFGLSLTDQTNYVSVPNPYSSGNVTVGLGGGLYNYFGLWWGSVDKYNTLSFLKGGVEVEKYTGTQAINPSTANGNQTAPSTNVYVNFYNLPYFDSFKMTSGLYAFEADNIVVGNIVPEPGTMMLLGIGMLGMAIYGKRRMKRES